MAKLSIEHDSRNKEMSQAELSKLRAKKLAKKLAAQKRANSGAMQSSDNVSFNTAEASEANAKALAKARANRKGSLATELDDKMTGAKQNVEQLQIQNEDIQQEFEAVKNSKKLGDVVKRKKLQAQSKMVNEEIAFQSENLNSGDQIAALNASGETAEGTGMEATEGSGMSGAQGMALQAGAGAIAGNKPSAAGGAVKGAASGAAVGGWAGAAVGAVVGGMQGGAQASAAKKEKQRQANLQAAKQRGADMQNIIANKDQRLQQAFSSMSSALSKSLLQQNKFNF